MLPAAILATWIGGGQGNIAMGWGLLVCVCGYCVAFSIGFGPVPWLYPSEIYPMNVKERALSLSVLSQWFNNFVIAFLVPHQVQLMKPGGTFFFYAACCSMAWVFVYVFVPETKGRSLESMDDLFGSQMKSGYAPGVSTTKTTHVAPADPQFHATTASESPVPTAVGRLVELQPA